MKKCFIHFVAAVMAMGSTIAFSGNHGHNKFINFFDANQDGSVTLEEFDRASANRYLSMDADGNGSVSSNEFQHYVQTRRSERRFQYFQKIDTDSDQQVSLQEFLEAKRIQAEKQFAGMDSDSDGLVSVQEHARIAKTNRHHRYGIKRVFQKLDADANGLVTQEESHAAWTQWFDKLDANTDRVVSEEEVGQARRQQTR